MTTYVGVLRAPSAVSRRALSAGTFILLGLIDIFVFGLFSHHGDASFALSLPDASVHVPTVHIPAAPVAYALGAVSIALGILRATIDLGKRANRWSIAVVLGRVRVFPAAAGRTRAISSR